MSQLFLGLDCSTQSLTGLIIDFTLNSIISRYQIIFDKDLPHYNTRNGVIILDDNKVVHSYPLMWVDALNHLFKNLSRKQTIIKNIKAISGSGQQHGTVYLNEKFEEKLQKLSSNKLLSEQLQDVFTRDTSPIWMDSSTHQQCNEIRESLGGLEESFRITGSNITERFSGPQIRKFYQENPDLYQKTSIIHLVSSFMASLLIGKNAPIDHGDGTGMNLMNIEIKDWDERALEATAPDLLQRLPKLISSNERIGNISDYFIEKYGFDKEVRIIAWSGDNPNSLIGQGLIKKGKVSISLGTSDVYFGYMHNLSMGLKSDVHVFRAPTGDYMSLLCYKNGALAREKIKNRYNLNWVQFSSILKSSPAGNNGKIMLPYFFPEIVPLVLEPKVYRFGFDENDKEGNIRAIIEAQFLSMKLHSKWIEDIPEEIYATGGASENKEILQIIADIFNTKVKYLEITDSAALGAAIRSIKSFYEEKKQDKTWEEITCKFLNSQASEFIYPNEKNKQLYEDMVDLYKEYEDFILYGGKNPEYSRKDFITKYFE